MNTSSISQKIINQRFEEMNKLDRIHFYAKAVQQHLFSDFEFITYYQKKGIFFWNNVIFNTDISFNKLFKHFGEYLLDDEFHEHVIKVYQMNLDRDKCYPQVVRIIKICERYFYEYRKYN